MITNVCFWVAMFFFVAAICCGVDAFKLEKRISSAWCAVITWCILIAGCLMFGIVLVSPIY